MQTVEEFQIQFRVIFEELNLICFHCRYEMSNCLFESAYEETLRVCNCVPSFHQVALGEMPWLRICTGTKLKCMKKIFHGIGNYKLVSISMNRINGNSFVHSSCITISFQLNLIRQIQNKNIKRI